jgi:hypothetical protein
MPLSSQMTFSGPPHVAGQPQLRFASRQSLRIKHAQPLDSIANKTSRLEDRMKSLPNTQLAYILNGGRSGQIRGSRSNLPTYHFSPSTEVHTGGKTGS